MRLGWLGLMVWAPPTWASLWTELAENFSSEKAPPDVRMITEQARWLRGNEVDTLARARPWLAYIYAQTQAKDVPAELALLPFVESAFDPKAISKADARGMWQFIDSTGKAYGLAAESGCEPRYDVIRSTDAALSHLKDLSGANRRLVVGSGGIQCWPKCRQNCAAIQFGSWFAHRFLAPQHLA